MPKKRKTRQQKLYADLRRKPENTLSSDVQTTKLAGQDKPLAHPQSIFSLQPTKSQFASASPYLTLPYTYLSKDLRKTAMITGTIIVAELLLFTIIK